MSTPDVLLRRARWSELLFGIVALLLALGVPLTPFDGRTVFMLVNWYGVAVVALWLAVALRRPTRTAWALAVVLCVYFVAQWLIGPPAWRPAFNGGAPEFVWVLIPVLVLMAALAQIGVGIRCWQARAIWTQNGDAINARFGESRE